MYATILKDASASKKAWLSRARAVVHGGKDASGKSVGFVAKDGKPLTKIEMENLTQKPIPPQWKDVMVSGIKGSALLAEGTDGKGKRQPLYSLQHSDSASVAKFQRVSKLNERIAGLMTKAKRDMNNASLPQRERDNAATTYLIAKTGFRPGGSVDGDKSPNDQAYGASTLEKRHVSVDGESITFEFKGKHLVTNSKRIRDKGLAEYLGGRLKSLQPDDQVFLASGASINNYMKKLVGSEFKVKDLRTWNGTAIARHLISSEDTPADAKALKEQQKRISTMVSKHLGNTPAVALSSYIDPLLWKHTGGMTSVKEK